ncbi:hypothetical protein FRB93_010265 [Tulasnella sp. JGI-2019a]|nr:hypothetical protein FRB93_010265 [Tulasnella sp. JGI-2019a]
MSDGSKRSLCIIGAAGRGKSSVSASVAEQGRSLGRLGAEFYFTMDQKDRNEGVVPVLARQLASWQGGKLRSEIASAIHADRDIAQRRLEVQFRELIQEPLETLTDGPDSPKLLILLDGLDECDNEYAHRLLNLLGESSSKLSPSIKFILTSRPEPHLLHCYRSNPMDAQLEVRSLDLEKEVEVESDIGEFFKQTLPVTVMVKNSPNWPGDKRRKALVQLSQGLWIFAVTVARMLAEPKCHDPEELLAALLSVASDPHRAFEPNSNLDSIYSRILVRACPPDSTILTLFQDILGVLCVLVEPVNIHTLTSLIYPDHSDGKGFTHDIRTKVLGYLQAVLIVPDVDEDDPSRDAKPIRFVHKSFKDHLTDESRCDARFLVNTAEQHRRMAMSCLRHMEDLHKPNICDLDSTTLNNDIGRNTGGGGNKGDGIRGLVQRHISSALQYACKSWATHVSCASSECDDVYASVDIFTKTRLLYWLEVLSLLGLTRNVARLVQSVEAWLKARPQQATPIPSDSPSPILPHRIATILTEGLRLHLWPDMMHTSLGPLHLWALDHVKRLLPVQKPDVPSQGSTLPTESDISILNLLQDVKSFVTEFEIPIHTSTPHIYHSALPFTPPHTSLSRLYSHLAEGGPKPRHGWLQQWPRHEWCVAWSPDGQRIVSGSADGTLLLWDPSRGIPVGEVWKFHIGRVLCVAWSPDGEMIVSGSDDKTLQLWDSTTGARIGEAWEGHSGVVFSLAWSPYDRRVISGSKDGTLRMWDPFTGVPIGEPWKGHIDNVYCVTWSPDGKRIASGGEDGVILWDSSTGALIGRPSPSTAYGLAWSPDGKGIVSAHYKFLRLWDSSTGKRIGGDWTGHTNVVREVAWSPDGKTIVSGSFDKTIRLWDASGAPIGNAWRVHGEVWSLSWSPDGEKIASGSGDGVVLWISKTGEPFRLQPETNCHTRPISRLAFTSNSDKIVSASLDGTFCLWDTYSGAFVGRPVRQTTKITDLGFSLNGKYVVSEDEDECRTIWEISGEETGFEGGAELGPAVGDHARVLKIDRDGWLQDPAGKKMFWLPSTLRPFEGWGRVLANGNILAIENPNVPIIDISAYASRFFDSGSDV